MCVCVCVCVCMYVCICVCVMRGMCVSKTQTYSIVDMARSCVVCVYVCV